MLVLFRAAHCWIHRITWLNDHLTSMFWHIFGYVKFMEFGGNSQAIRISKNNHYFYCVAIFRILRLQKHFCQPCLKKITAILLRSLHLPVMSVSLNWLITVAANLQQLDSMKLYALNWNCSAATLKPHASAHTSSNRLACLTMSILGNDEHICRNDQKTDSY